MQVLMTAGGFLARLARLLSWLTSQSRNRLMCCSSESMRWGRGWVRAGLGTQGWHRVSQHALGAGAAVCN